MILNQLLIRLTVINAPCAGTAKEGKGLVVGIDNVLFHDRLPGKVESSGGIVGFAGGGHDDDRTVHGVSTGKASEAQGCVSEKTIVGKHTVDVIAFNRPQQVSTFHQVSLEVVLFGICLHEGIISDSRAGFVVTWIVIKPRKLGCVFSCG